MFSIVVILASNNCIGKDNDLLWYIPEDLKHFKEITNGSTIVMGRKCFLSLPSVLPNRKHIVFSKSPEFSIDDDNVKVLSDAYEFIEQYKSSDEEIFIIGGAEIYTLFMPYVNKLYLTKVDKAKEGDVFFPSIDYDKFCKTYESQNFYNKANDLHYKFENYERITD